MGIYARYVLPRLTDLTMARKLLLPYRQRVIGGAAGCSLKPHRPDAEDRP